MSRSFFITNKTKAKLPSLAFEFMKNHVLGKNYDLSFVIVGDKLMRKLNKERRNVDKNTDILSFSITDEVGEIFLNLNSAKKEAQKFDRDFKNFLGFLFIHGLFHLKGMAHGSKMEGQESRVRKLFGFD